MSLTHTTQAVDRIYGPLKKYPKSSKPTEEVLVKQAASVIILKNRAFSLERMVWAPRKDFTESLTLGILK